MDLTSETWQFQRELQGGGMKVSATKVGSLGKAMLLGEKELEKSGTHQRHGIKRKERSKKGKIKANALTLII